MSWWVSLMEDGGGVVEVPSHKEGGTYAVGGSTDASLNVTYNYGLHFRKVLGGNGLWDLDGMKGKHAFPILLAAVEKLGTETDEDYWAATPGNAGFALAVLLAWVRLHPEAVFRVS